MNVRDRGRRRLALTSAGVGVLAVGGVVAVAATRAAPAHAATVPASAQHSESSQQGSTESSSQPSAVVPQPVYQGGGADAGSSGS